MQLAQLLQRHNVTQSDLDIIASCMLEGLGLEDTASKLNGKLTLEQVFSVASCYAKEEFESSISEISPQMMLDRMEMNMAKRPDILRQRQLNQEIKRLNAIEEDLLMLEAERAA